MHKKQSWAILLALTGVGLYGASAPPQSAVVRQAEGQLHGFLVLRTLEGAIVADGDLSQSIRGNQVTSHLVYRFKDGSVHEETSVFTQAGRFRLLSSHLVQKGPTFKRPLLDVSINRTTGIVKVHYQDEDGKDKTTSDHMDLPADLANGIVPILLKNLASGAQATTASMVVATPKPLLVKLQVSAAGEDSFTTGSSGHKARKYSVHVDIGGIRGVIAPIVGKQPPDTLVWIFSGPSPSFVGSEGPLFEGGPIWRTELVSPAWHRGQATENTADRKK